jgi:hypothetical protein
MGRRSLVVVGGTVKLVGTVKLGTVKLVGDCANGLNWVAWFASLKTALLKIALLIIAGSIILFTDIVVSLITIIFKL